MNATLEKADSHGRPARIHRHASLIRWLSLAVIVSSLFLLSHQIPMGRILESMENWISGLGVWGPVLFALIYALAVVALVPASLLTIAAGALFGLAIGTITVSLASTSGAALTFLIARYLVRDRVEQAASRHPPFGAIDRALSEGGWKVVALLRLSPAVPFSLQNYFYGVTGIGFRTCILTSWAAMLPGTLLYVYLGYAGRAGLQTAAGEGGKSPVEWILLIVGLLATVVVTVYLTRLARRTIREQTS